MYRIALLIALCFGLVACNQNDKKISSWEVNDVYHSTVITPNAATGTKTYAGPPINTEDENNTYEMFSLKTEKTSQGVSSYQLVVQLTYFSKWRYYNAATLNNNPATNFSVVGREAGGCDARGCIFRELLSIQLPADFVKSHMNKGFQISISSQSGITSDLYVPPQYLQGYLKAVEGSNN
jgi:hypothetical protein